MIKLELNDKGLVSSINQDTDPDWITLYQTKTGKLPAVPKSLLSLVNNYVEGQPISQTIQVIPISGQQWSLLNKKQKRFLLELVEWLGGNADDYCRLWMSMLPRGR